jgi:hypothetical protein
MMSAYGTSCSVRSILSVTCSATCCAVAPGQLVRITMARKVNGGSSSCPSWKKAAAPSSISTIIR